ncbi:MAG TPA: hypothetical protein VNA66_07150 [Gammaproteobacteria bacterium]|nr:hypothetical protein [Gammaproteobacteria bacterium]
MRGIKGALLLLCCSWLTGLRAQEGQPERGRGPPAPDLDFLEYLGTWAEGDDEWLAIEEFRKDLSADASDARGGENAEGAEDVKGAEGAKESETERDDDHESE